MKFITILTFITLFSFANYSEYYTLASGLEPKKSINIELKKEVLNISRVELDTFRVDALYFLYNKGKAKEIQIGFEVPELFEDKTSKYIEASSDKREQIIQKGSEFIEDLTIKLNNKKVNYKIADASQINKSVENISYLYYFKAKINKGLNVIKHSYRCNTAAFADQRYSFEYLLSTAKSWGSGKIGEFELNLNMGKIESFTIKASFFNSFKNWKVKNGLIKFKTTEDGKFATFYLSDGKATFKTKNFTPKKSIEIDSFEFIDDKLVVIFDYKKDILPFYQSYYPIVMDHSFSVFFAKDITSMRILRNLPYARRGYVFKNKSIANYYNKMPWYKKNKNYKPSINNLTKNERLFFKDIEKLKRDVLMLIKYPKKEQNIELGSKLLYFITHSNWHTETNSITKLSKNNIEFIKNLESKKSISDSGFFRIFNNYTKEN